MHLWLQDREGGEIEIRYETNPPLLIGKDKQVHIKLVPEVLRALHSFLGALLPNFPTCDECNRPCDPDGYCDPCATWASAVCVAMACPACGKEVERLDEERVKCTACDRITDVYEAIKAAEPRLTLVPKTGWEQ